MRPCDALIAPSAAFAEATHQVYGVAPVSVHNGRSRAVTLALKRDIPIVTAGRLWDEAKGAATLDAAAALMEVPILALGPIIGPQGQRIRLNHLRSVGSRPERRLLRRWPGRVSSSPLPVTSRLG